MRPWAGRLNVLSAKTPNFLSCTMKMLCGPHKCCMMPPKEQIETVCYNIVGVFPSLTAKEVELAIKKFIPEAKFTYKPDPWVMDYYRSHNNFDDSRAREEWRWKPLYADFEKIVADFIKEVRSKPEYYSPALTDT